MAKKKLFLAPLKPTGHTKLSPLRDAILVLCPDVELPLSIVPEGVFSTQELTEEQNTLLQEHCCLHGRPAWNTGIGIMDAADAMIEEAICNANIRRPG